MTNRIEAAVRCWLDSREDRRWLPSPTGCCECGTGGPYYNGDQPQVTRYLYGDWSACSAHPLTGAEPTVDYGRDVVVSFAQAKVDHDAAVDQ